MLDQRGDVVRHVLDAQRAVDVGRAPVALQVDRDDLAVRGERGQQVAEHPGRAEAAV